MKRYQVVTWSWDIGSDEHMDYSKFNEAYRAARKYLGTEEYAAIYDHKEKIAYVVFGDPATEVFNSNVRMAPVAASVKHCKEVRQCVYIILQETNTALFTPVSV